MHDIPLFPLNIFLLPGDFTQLYIFEERYKQLINECVEKNQPFGIPFSSRINTLKLGSLVKVSEVIKRHPSGEIDILVQSVGLFRLNQFNFQKEDKLYPTGDISGLEKVENFSASPSLMDKFKKYLLEYGNVANKLLSVKQLLVFDIANELYLTEVEKLELLRCETKEEYNSFLENYLHYLNLLEEQEKSVYQNIYLN